MLATGKLEDMNIHIEFELQLVFTVVVALAVCAAGWRFVRAASRRRDSTPDRDPEKDDAR